MWWVRATVVVVGGGGRASCDPALNARAFEAGVFVTVDMPDDELVKIDDADYRKVCCFQKQDAGTTQCVIGGEEKAEGSDSKEWEQVERRVEMGQAVGS